MDEQISNCSDTESIESISREPAGWITLNGGGIEVAKLLECPVCYDIILPPIILCNQGHAVCNTCRKNLRTCPTCRGVLSGVRNLFAENLLDKCSISCKFKDGGCTVALPGRMLVEHQANCNNRPILCRECDTEIPYNKFLEHLRVEEKLETQRATECATGFEIEEEEISRRAEEERYSVWEPTWINAHGHDFFCFLETSKQHWWIWIGGFASPEECSKFYYSLTVWNKENETEMKYTGKVHSIRTTPDEVLRSGQCLIFLDVNLKNYIYKGGIDVLVRIDCEYQPPKTRKGAIVESPVTMFGCKNTPNYKDLTSRVNRVSRISYMSRNISTGNDTALINVPDVSATAVSSVAAHADHDLNDILDHEE